MARRQREWARRARATLVELLGEKCAQCGSTENLELDCKTPQGDHHHKREWSWRISFYRAQFAAGNLQLLCTRCHTRKSHSDDLVFHGISTPRLSGLRRVPFSEAESASIPF